MSFESTPQPQRAMQHREEHRHIEHYSDLSQKTVEQHHQEIATLENEIHNLEKRFHDVAQMTLIGKIGAIVSGLPRGGTLESMYKRLARLKADPRFKGESETAQ